MAIRDMSESVRIEKEILRKCRALAKEEGRLLTFVLSRMLEIALVEIVSKRKQIGR